MKKNWIYLFLIVTLTSCDFDTINSQFENFFSELIPSNNISSLSSSSENTSSSLMSSESITSSIVSSNTSTSNVSIHFLELGNQFIGDSVYIKVDDIDILIDAGSRQNSSSTLIKYIDQYCTDKTLEYVIATHAHQDHIAGFVGNSSNIGLLEYYQCKTIIDFPKTNSSSKIYNSYKELVEAQETDFNTKHFTALECYNESVEGAKRSYTIGNNVTLNILYQKYYENYHSEENNYSVCILLSQGDNHFLFTGDLETVGEKSLIESNSLPHVKVYKGGHHGSETSSSEDLLDVITPENICICTCCGTQEYPQTFPYQSTIDRMAKYTDKIYCTTQVDKEKTSSSSYTVKPMNGNIIVKSTSTSFSITGTNNSIILKDTDWFKKNRTWPTHNITSYTLITTR